MLPGLQGTEYGKLGPSDLEKTFGPKSALDMQYIDYGLGAFRARTFEAYPEDQPLDLATVYQDLVHQGQLAGFVMTQRFFEIGSPEGLEETRRYLEQKGRL